MNFFWHKDFLPKLKIIFLHKQCFLYFGFIFKFTYHFMYGKI